MSIIGKTYTPSRRCHSDWELAGGFGSAFLKEHMSIHLSNMDKWHTHYQTSCNISKKINMGDAELVKAPTAKYSKFTLWETQVV